MHSVRTVDLADARRTIGAGTAEADRVQPPGSVAVADAGGNLVARVRMDGARLGSVGRSVDRAHTGVLFRSAAGDPARAPEPGGQFRGTALSGPGRVLVFAGGAPLVADGEVAGAVGVGGGAREQDTAVAEAVAAAS